MPTRRSVFDTSSSASRREQILNIATDFFAERGYHSVGIDDIGAAAGVTGPAIYRHFESKSALLTALFNKLTDELVARAHQIVANAMGAEETLRQLVRYQTEMCVYDRALIKVYLSEFRSLPKEDQSTLRVKQRAYLFDWMRTLGMLHPSYSEAELRALVQGAIAVSHSVVYYQSTLDDEDLIEFVAGAAEGMLRAPRPAATVIPSVST